jgi:hypothetical protein
MIDVLISWLADGTPPVEPELAQQRGVVCSTCPLNVTENWWERISKQPVAAVIKKWLEVKDQMKIGVPIESEVGICRACGCCLKLKLHEPIKYIIAHTDREVMQKYVSDCWVRTEGKIP